MSCAQGRCGPGWSQGILFGVTAVIIAAERSALTYSLVHCLLVGQLWWAGWVLGLSLPAVGVQVLSFLWFLADGDKRKGRLFVVHCLQLGIYKRLWDCACCAGRRGADEELGVAIMRKADVSALRLLEALLLSLPQALLHTYLLLSSDAGLLSTVAACSAACLLSLCWALVLYSWACVLIRPGHLALPPASLLCQLLWRVGTVGARVVSLAFFTRVFRWWVYPVAGLHWLTASFWLVSQQTDICPGTWRWRLWNAVMGVVHVFCFLNLKDGPSRFRMAGFYVVMLLENTTLVLSASDFLSAASWDSVGVLSAMLGSFLLGIFSLVVYYHFLHPKSTEISHSLWGGPGGSACWEKGELSFSLGDKMAAAPPLHVTGSLSLSGLAGSLLGPPGSYGSESQGESGHHHWLLLRLALKTGDRGKISQAYGAGAVEAILNVELYHPETDDMSSPASDWDHGIVPFTEEWREDPQGPDQKPSPEDEQQGEQEEERTELGSPLDSQELEFQRGSPEGKSVLGDSPELNVCPTESSSTLYFSADPQSPSSASNPGLDRDGGGDSVAELSPISSEPVALRGGRVWLGRAEPRFTSTPKQETSPQEQQGTHMAGARRQLLPWRREEAGHS